MSFTKLVTPSNRTLRGSDSAGACSASAMLRRLTRLRRLIMARRGAEGDGQAVPGVDGHDGHREIDELLFVELRLRLLVHLVRRVPLADVRHRLSPREGRPFAIAVHRRLAPRIEH